MSFSKNDPPPIVTPLQSSLFTQQPQIPLNVKLMQQPTHPNSTNPFTLISGSGLNLQAGLLSVSNTAAISDRRANIQGLVANTSILAQSKIGSHSKTGLTGLQFVPVSPQEQPQLTQAQSAQAGAQQSPPGQTVTQAHQPDSKQLPPTAAPLTNPLTAQQSQPINLHTAFNNNIGSNTGTFPSSAQIPQTTLPSVHPLPLNPSQVPSFPTHISQLTQQSCTQFQQFPAMKASNPTTENFGNFSTFPATAIIPPTQHSMDQPPVFSGFNNQLQPQNQPYFQLPPQTASSTFPNPSLQNPLTASLPATTALPTGLQTLPTTLINPQTVPTTAAAGPMPAQPQTQQYPPHSVPQLIQQHLQPLQLTAQQIQQLQLTPQQQHQLQLLQLQQQQQQQQQYPQPFAQYGQQPPHLVPTQPYGMQPQPQQPQPQQPQQYQPLNAYPHPSANTINLMPVVDPFSPQYHQYQQAYPVGHPQFLPNQPHQQYPQAAFNPLTTSPGSTQPSLPPSQQQQQPGTTSQYAHYFPQNSVHSLTSIPQPPSTSSTPSTVHQPYTSGTSTQTVPKKKKTTNNSAKITYKSTTASSGVQSSTTTRSAYNNNDPYDQNLQSSSSFPPHSSQPNVSTNNISQSTLSPSPSQFGANTNTNNNSSVSSRTQQSPHPAHFPLATSSTNPNSKFPFYFNYIPLTLDYPKNYPKSIVIPYTPEHRLLPDGIPCRFQLISLFEHLKVLLAKTIIEAKSSSNSGTARAQAAIQSQMGGIQLDFLDTYNDFWKPDPNVDENEKKLKKANILKRKQRQLERFQQASSIKTESKSKSNAMMVNDENDFNNEVEIIRDARTNIVDIQLLKDITSSFSDDENDDEKDETDDKTNNNNKMSENYQNNENDDANDDDDMYHNSKKKQKVNLDHFPSSLLTQFDKTTRDLFALQTVALHGYLQIMRSVDDAEITHLILVRLAKLAKNSPHPPDFVSLPPHSCNTIEYQDDFSQPIVTTASTTATPMDGQTLDPTTPSTSTTPSNTNHAPATNFQTIPNPMQPLVYHLYNFTGDIPPLDAIEHTARYGLLDIRLIQCLIDRLKSDTFAIPPDLRTNLNSRWLYRVSRLNPHGLSFNECQDISHLSPISNRLRIQHYLLSRFNRKCLNDDGNLIVLWANERIGRFSGGQIYRETYRFREIKQCTFMEPLLQVSDCFPHDDWWELGGDFDDIPQLSSSSNPSSNDQSMTTSMEANLFTPSSTTSTAQVDGFSPLPPLPSNLTNSTLSSPQNEHVIAQSASVETSRKIDSSSSSQQQLQSSEPVPPTITTTDTTTSTQTNTETDTDSRTKIPTSPSPSSIPTPVIPKFTKQQLFYQQTQKTPMSLCYIKLIRHQLLLQHVPSVQLINILTAYRLSRFNQICLSFLKRNSSSSYILTREEFSKFVRMGSFLNLLDFFPEDMSKYVEYAMPVTPGDVLVKEKLIIRHGDAVAARSPTVSQIELIDDSCNNGASSNRRSNNITAGQTSTEHLLSSSDVNDDSSLMINRIGNGNDDGNTSEQPTPNCNANADSKLNVNTNHFKTEIFQVDTDVYGEFEHNDPQMMNDSETDSHKIDPLKNTKNKNSRKDSAVAMSIQSVENVEDVIELDDKNDQDEASNNENNTNNSTRFSVSAPTTRRGQRQFHNDIPSNNLNNKSEDNNSLAKENTNNNNNNKNERVGKTTRSTALAAALAVECSENIPTRSSARLRSLAPTTDKVEKTTTKSCKNSKNETPFARLCRGLS